MKIVWTGDLLQAATSTGKTKFWRKHILQDGSKFYTQSESWQQGESGESKHVFSEPAFAEPKNVGRANETTSEAQAELEAHSEYEKKKDKGYFKKGEKARSDTLTLPMLAHRLDKKEKYVTFGCYVQPKLNGIRCLYNSKIGAWSRQLNMLIPEVYAHLRIDTNGDTLDGELMLPAPYTFQDTISAIKKFDPELSPLLEYHVYDIVIPDLEFDMRFLSAMRIVKDGKNKQVKLVPTELIRFKQALMHRFAEFVKAGYEGLIVRNRNGYYKPGHRSNDLLKYKEMKDDEFEIIGFEDGKGRDKGAIKFLCKTSKGIQFGVRPEGSMDERRKMFKNGKSYIGKELTVRYQVLSDDGVPIFPVGVAVRDYE